MLFSAYGQVLREACEATGCVTDPAEDLAAVVRETDLGPDLLSAIGIFGIVDPDYGGLPDLLHAAAGGDVRLEGFLEDFRADTRVPAADLSQGLHASTLCAEAVWPWEGDSALAGRAAALDAYVASLSGAGIVAVRPGNLARQRAGRHLLELASDAPAFA